MNITSGVKFRFRFSVTDSGATVTAHDRVICYEAGPGDASVRLESILA